MTTLNDAFEWELTQKDEGYESGSESLGIPTPLRRVPWICHISTSENISFQTYHTTCHSCTYTKKTPLEDSEAAALYIATIWCLAVPTKRALNQIAAHSMEEQNHLH